MSIDNQHSSGGIDVLVLHIDSVLLRGASTPDLYPRRHQRELTGWGED